MDTVLVLKEVYDLFLISNLLTEAVTIHVALPVNSGLVFWRHTVVGCK